MSIIEILDGNWNTDAGATAQMIKDPGNLVPYPLILVKIRFILVMVLD